MTRKDYMDGKVTFEEFYRSVNEAAGLKFSDEEFLARVKSALDSGDEHLNTIPLAVWDRKGEGPVLRTNLTRAMMAHGDWLTPAGIVCCLKQAAKDAVNAGR